MVDILEPPSWQVRIEDADFEEGIRVVVMPCCGFSFDAIHTDLDGETYSCSSCCSERLEAENKRLRRVLNEIIGKLGHQANCNAYHINDAGKPCNCDIAEAVAILEHKEA